MIIQDNKLVYHTIVIRHSYMGSDPIRTPVESKPSKHAPDERGKKMSTRNTGLVLSKGNNQIEEQNSAPTPRLIFTIEVC